MSEPNENPTILNDEQAQSVSGGVSLGDLLQRGPFSGGPGTLVYRGGAEAVTLEQNPFRSRKEQEADGKRPGSVPTAL